MAFPYKNIIYISNSLLHLSPSLLSDTFFNVPTSILCECLCGVCAMWDGGDHCSPWQDTMTVNYKRQVS